ncbi:Cytochrome c oxidase, subunit II [Mesorhizobium sp. ORS 3324]|nr:Cytochrome c oxidase, subunit II [Mesorhizobium sp. ORS 3324]
MKFWSVHKMQNFEAGDCPGHPPWHSGRVDAAKQKNAANKKEGEKRRDVEPWLAQDPGVASETHRFASLAPDEHNNIERHHTVPHALLHLLSHAAERARTLSAGPISIAVGSAALSGCAGVQSALDPRGEQAHTLAVLFWTFTAVLALVWFLTMAGLIFALAHRRNRRGEPAQPRAAVKRPMLIAFCVMLASSTIILSGLAVLSFGAQKAIFGSGAGAALTISVIGHQWWWQVRYEGDGGFETANEIRIPAGSPVDIKLTTADVIHSFWIPSLAGKLDLIPGKSNELRIQASKPGVYRGQCAEFCGQQHAHMAIFVVALEPREFERWRAGQAAPVKPTAHLGRQGVFTLALLENAQ